MTVSLRLLLRGLHLHTLLHTLPRTPSTNSYPATYASYTSESLPERFIDGQGIVHTSPEPIIASTSRVRFANPLETIPVHHSPPSPPYITPATSPEPTLPEASHFVVPIIIYFDSHQFEQFGLIVSLDRQTDRFPLLAQTSPPAPLGIEHDELETLTSLPSNTPLGLRIRHRRRLIRILYHYLTRQQHYNRRLTEIREYIEVLRQNSDDIHDLYSTPEPSSE